MNKTHKFQYANSDIIFEYLIGPCKIFRKFYCALFRLNR